jgi:hypothetical protein
MQGWQRVFVDSRPPIQANRQNGRKSEYLSRRQAAHLPAYFKYQILTLSMARLAVP